MPSFSRAAVFRLSAMGDVALITGVLAHWQHKHGTQFTVITRKSLAPLFLHHPAVEEIIPLSDDEIHHTRTVFPALAARCSKLPLIDLHGTLRSRMLAHYWRGPVLRYPKFAMQRRLFLLSRGHFFRKTLLRFNVPQRYALALDPAPPLRSSLLPCIFLTNEERENAAVLLSAHPAPVLSRPLVALHPYATHPGKTWPAANWLELCRLLDGAGIAWFAVGQSQNPIELPSTGLNFTNVTGLRSLCAVLARASVLVTGDSGPMHLAGAVGTPCLALFGPTCEEWGFFPQGEHDNVLQAPLPCRPCSLHGGSCARGHQCMASLSPEQVAQSVSKALFSK